MKWIQSTYLLSISFKLQNNSVRQMVFLQF
jgi:hypothetical protein